MVEICECKFRGGVRATSAANLLEYYLLLSETLKSRIRRIPILSSPSTATPNQPIIIQYRGHPGLVAGILACVFGVLGILFLGIPFVPLAALCSVVALVRGIVGKSATGIGLSAVGAFLSVIGFIVSPSVWIAFAALFLAHEISATNQPTRESLEQNRIQQLNYTNARLLHFVSASESVDSKLPVFQTRLDTITSKMDDYLNRERELISDPDAAVTRGQISVAISQGNVATYQLHNQLVSLEQQFQTEAVLLARYASNASQSCRRTSDTPSGAEKIACDQLHALLQPFNREYLATHAALTNAETAFQQANEKQQALVQTSERIE